jgi:hypothetical protein
MRRRVLGAIALLALGLVGCGKVAPAAFKAVAGGGAKAAPKVVVHAAPLITPRPVVRMAPLSPHKVATAKPASEGSLWRDVGQEVAQQGAEHGLQQITGGDEKRR